MAKHEIDRAYGVTKAAVYVGIHRSTFSRWIRSGVAPAPDGATPNGDLRWHRSTLDRFLRDKLSPRVA